MSKITKLIQNPNMYFKDSKYLSFLYNKKQKIFLKKTSEEYMMELTKFIRNYNVNEIKMEDEIIWPYLRNRLWIQLYSLGHGKLKKAKMKYNGLQLGSQQDIGYESRENLKTSHNAIEITDLKKEEVDCLFFVSINASEQVKLPDESIYHRITDPLYEKVSKAYKSKKIEIVKTNSPALEKSKNYHHKVLHILPPYIYKYGYNNNITYGSKRFISLLKRFIPSLDHSYTEYDKFIDWEMHTRDYYIEILKKFTPKFIFLNGFHYQAPLISAANKLGIKTIDVQHGIQVGWNPLYNQWNELPIEGYSSLPDYFFVWSEKEQKNIKKVFNSEKHKPVIMGFPWLDKQLEFAEPLNEEYILDFDKYNIKILIALQNQSEIPTLIKDLIQKSSANILWIVRHHPKGRKFVKSDFINDNNKNLLISDYFDKISLLELLKHMDITLSEGSTVASEADYMGVCNILFGNKGKNNYSNEVRKKEFFHINNIIEFNNLVSNLDFSIKKSKANLYSKVNIEQVFTKLFKNKD